MDTRGSNLFGLVMNLPFGDCTPPLKVAGNNPKILIIKKKNCAILLHLAFLRSSQGDKQPQIKFKSSSSRYFSQIKHL
jgi:hypothetical protein